MVAVFSSQDAVVLVTALITFLGAVITLGVPLFLTVRRAHTTGQEVTQIAVEARDNAAVAAAATEAVAAQTRPNGGSTMRDAVDRMEKAQAENFLSLAHQIERLESRLVTIDQRVTFVEHQARRP